jgi:DNA polymerase-3 subunit alpha
LVVSDLVKFAKDADIGVGPARGSAAASLVCYLLRITEVNPMLFPFLVFERFIDITREDLPDIDLDFESTRRGEIVDYLVGKYGREYVSNIGTFSTYKSKIALDDVARVYRIPKYEVDGIKDVLLERSSGDLRASATIEDTIEQFEQAQKVIERNPDLMKATQLEGNVRGFGVHAAGVAVSNHPITDVTSILEREVRKRQVQVIAIDKYDAEQLGILKIDLLGLSAIDALVKMCKLLGQPPSFLYEIPTVDQEVIRGFKENDVVGIFQFEGRAMRMVNGSVRPDDFNEVCHITALARPGPLHNGAVSDYVDIKRGVKQPSLMHPALDEITAFTQWQVVYQEQILRIVREIGDFDWTHAAYIRKIISRKLGDQEFNRQWERFYSGAQRLHPDMTEEMARSIWGLCTTAGSYAFNFAHSVSYGYIAWWTMWFKRHHPEMFFAAMLDRADKKTAGGGGAGGSANAKATVTSKAKLDGQVIMLRDALSHGFKILPYDLRESDLTWKHEGERGLRPGFDQIEGVGPSMAGKIMDWRDSITDWRGIGWSSLIDVHGIGEKTIDRIVDHATAEDPFGVHRLEKMIVAVKEAIPDMSDRQGNPLPSPTHTAVEVPYERGEDEEIIWIGVAVHKNLRDIFEVNRARTGEELNPEEVRDPHLNEWMLLAGYDGTDLLSLRITRWRYPALKNLLWKISLNEDVLLVRGVKRGWRAAREIQVSDIWVIDAEL